jgi:hypothetical protein
VRKTAQEGIDILLKLVAFQEGVFDVDDLVFSDEILPSLLYSYQMLDYVNHKPEAFIIDDEGGLIPTNGNKRLQGKKQIIPSLK